ncbi:galactose mutarotase-like [Coccinella septempunctata]|uniref:galactose mutarotase-like n=1 Tax=Coccinella septempunctata TaxID=41139 RepID=UPI001D0787F6|nr:galactose mutarotase-like [Coccinella septempunctata]
MVNAPCGRRIQNPIPCLRSCCDIGVTLSVEKFGHYRVNPNSRIAKPVKKFKWVNKNGMIVEAINYGATIISIIVPDRNGKFKDVVIGSDVMEDYLSFSNPYYGATIGRACNRIGHGIMFIDGKNYELSKNCPPHTLHGGFRGFDKILWSACREDKKITMSYHSKDGEEGFPGDLNVNIVMYLTDGNEFVIEYRAFTTKPTYVNLTNHTYFNLAGHVAGADELYHHKVCINAEHVTHTDKQMIPTGKLIHVGGTPFDFRIPKTLKEKIGSDMTNGFDQNFCVTLSEYQKNSFVARVVHPPSGRVLEVYSNQPGVQFYTANNFPEKTGDALQDRDNGVLGKRDCRYFKHAGFTLETQNYPDAVNHPEFPPAVLYPGNIYIHSLRYMFSVQRDKDFVPLRTSPLISKT